MLLITINVLQRASVDVTVGSVENQLCVDVAHAVNILVMLWFSITLQSHHSTCTSLFWLGTWGLGRWKGWVRVGFVAGCVGGVGRGGGVWRHERSESSERELKVLRRKEKKGNKNNILIKGRINFFFLLTFNYSAHLFIDVHCSNEGKIFTFSSTTIVWIFVFWWN